VPKPPIPLPKKPDEYLFGQLREKLDQLDKIEPCEARLTPDAEGLWNKFYIAFKHTLLVVDPLTAAMTKRIPTYAIKLVMTYAALERTLPKITAEQIAAAVKVANFGLNCAEHLIRGRQEFSTQGRCEKAVKKALESTQLPPWKIHHHIGGRFTHEELMRALRAMKETGEIVAVKTTTRGVPIYGLRGGRRDA
jgi:hypothetical protein